MSFKNCCVLACMDKYSPRHRFPMPKKYPDMYAKWIAAVGNELLGTLDPERVYYSYRVCHLHFRPEDESTNNTLKRSAVPILNLPTPKCSTESDDAEKKRPDLKILENLDAAEFSLELRSFPSDDIELRNEAAGTISNDLLISLLSSNNEDLESVADSAGVAETQNYIVDTPVDDLNDATKEVFLTPKLFDKICRLCLDHAPAHLDLSTVFYEGQPLISILQKYIGIDICANDCNGKELPRGICFPCTVNIITMHEFLKKCSVARKLLNAASNGPVGDHDYTPPTIKLDANCVNAKNILPKYCKEDFIKAGVKIVKPFGIGRSRDPLKCNICERTDFPTLSILRKHKLKHRMEIKTPNISHQCDICGRIFRRAWALQNHIKTHSADDKPYVCEFCGMKFKLLPNLTRHIMTHTGDRPYACDVCDKAYNQPVSLKFHRMTHNVGHYQCDQCDKHFRTEASHHTHRKWHRKKVLCPICGNFISKTDRENHLQRHETTGNLIECRFCPQLFDNFVDKNAHENAHTTVLRCEICRKAFKRRKNLTLHMAVHNKEKNHACTFCDKKYKQKPTLMKHVRQHHPLHNSYECKACDAVFRTYHEKLKHACHKAKPKNNVSAYLFQKTDNFINL